MTSPQNNEDKKHSIAEEILSGLNAEGNDAIEISTADYPEDTDSQNRKTIIADEDYFPEEKSTPGIAEQLLAEYGVFEQDVPAELSDDARDLENSHSPSEDFDSTVISLPLDDSGEEELLSAQMNTPESNPLSDHLDHVLPPTHEEKRNGLLNTKVMSPDHDDSDDFIFTKYKKTSSHSDKKGKRKNKKRFRDKPVWKRILIILGWIAGVLISLGLLLYLAFKITGCIGLEKLTDYENVNITAPIIEGVNITSSNNGKTMEYNGVTYNLNENRINILCIGVDKHGLGTEDENVGTGGHADALYWVSIDSKTGDTEIIAIPRDIVTDIGIYSSSGDYMRTEKAQICLAYAYGDGFEKSCENTVEAVERLFNGLPIHAYFAIDIDAIASLNDAVGGVTVTMQDDFFRSLNYGVQTRHYKGETIDLNGENAIRYVQQREVAELNSSIERQDRQINYLKAFSKKAIAMTKKDLGVPVDLYEIVSDNSVTDLDVTKISGLANLVVSPGIDAPNFSRIPGELISGGKYAEYTVDIQKFFEQRLEIFYTPQD